MAKKKPVAGAKKMPVTTEPATRHARIELPDDVYQRLKKVADRALLPVAAYIRQAVIERVERDEEKGKGGVK